jgi:hypothetical protein
MGNTAQTLHDQWKQADEVAREAESKIAVEWEAFFAQASEPPALDAIELVRDLRADASTKLNDFLAHMHESGEQ